MPAIGAEIEVTGISELVDKYVAGDLLAEGLLIEGMERAVNYVGKNAALFPAPETDANQPPPPYYIRGVGTQYANSNRGESQHLGDEGTWDKEITKENDGLIGTVTPTATYAPYVHGINSQRKFHADTGWRKVTQIAEDVTPHIVDIFSEATVKLIKFLKGG